MTLRALLSKRNAQINTLHDGAFIICRAARHIINAPARNEQAGRAPDSRVTNPSSSPDRRHFYSLQQRAIQRP